MTWERPQGIQMKNMEGVSRNVCLARDVIRKGGADESDITTEGVD